MRYVKYHALGNDYIVIRATDSMSTLDLRDIKLVCHRNYGVGSDGILLGPLSSETCDFRFRIFNPDGSEAEKSGNGLRIFARFLWDEGLVRQHRFTVETQGGVVTCRVDPDGKSVAVEMGRVSFDSTRIPVSGSPREVLRERMEVGGHAFEFCAATVGNPHCIVLCDTPAADIARRYGPLIEADSRFPNRTNVQFMAVIDRHNIRIEIWERGAGYTLASGSSSAAAAAVAKKLGLCDSEIDVHMPGGTLGIRLSDDFDAMLKGPVVRICHGAIDKEMFEE
ncbi:MAG: diaminopimelate epimerase [Planctomycetota bacterium]|jgi:diaminopimelate epimerase